jgi:hypothetical protein
VRFVEQKREFYPRQEKVGMQKAGVDDPLFWCQVLKPIIDSHSAVTCRARLRFEFTQDALATCKDVRPGSLGCGVFVDNVTVKSVKVSAP